MADWKEYKLGDFADIQTGPFGSQLHAADYVLNGIPSIMPTNIGSRLNIVTNDIVCITEKDAERLKKYTVKSGDIVYSRRGDVEKCAFITSEQNGWLCGTGSLRIRFISNEIEPKFCAYYLSTPAIKSWVLNNSVGSTMPNLNSSILKNLPLQLPPLPEQQAIAEVLSSLDDKIDLLHRQNKTLEAMAETLFRQWFVEEAEESWETYRFSELVRHVKPGTNFQPKRIENGIPFLNVRNLNNGFLDYSDISFISEEEYKRVHKNWIPEVNDVLISRIGTLGIVAVITEKDLPVAVHYNMINLKAKKTSFQFLYFLLKSSLFQEKYFSITRQSVQEYVAIEDVENIEIKLPLNQKEFRDKEQSFTELFTKIYSNKTQIQTLTKSRDELLPKLMSGDEVRVKISESGTAANY